MNHLPLSRRQWLLCSSLGTAAWLTGCATTQASTSAGTGHAGVSAASSAPVAPAASLAPGFVRQTVGNGSVVAVSDGMTRRPLDAGFVRNAPLDAVQAALAAQGLPTDFIDVPYTCFVLEVAGKRYLLDAGFADNSPAGTGLLHQNLRAAGIDPGSIDAVIISHMHGDHIHGLRRKDGTLVYPQAQVYVSAPEYHYWMSDANLAKAPEAARGGFANARRVFQGYPASHLKLFMPGRQLAPHIYTLSAAGHSPGQAVVSMVAGKERFTYLADVAHYPALFVRHPDWQVQFDMDAEAARQTRHHLLREVGQARSLVGGYHFPMPSMGHIALRSDGYHWQPLR